MNGKIHTENHHTPDLRVDEVNAQPLRVLVACEESQAVCIEFRKRGFEAFSCDTQPCSGGHPEWHYQDSIWHVLGKPGTQYPLHWDLIIGHPPCTRLSNSGVLRLYKDGKKENGIDPKMWQDMEDGAIFFRSLLYSNCDHIAIENPVIHGHALKIIGKKHDQTIQPYEFGHPESKRTCLWLKGLPKLKATEILNKPESGYWDNQTESGQNKLPPSPERAKLRSKTYPGIAKAMAEQWGDYLLQTENILSECLDIK